MHTFGVAGGSLDSDARWTTADRARQGRAGERECGQMLSRAFADDPDTYVFHDLGIPGYDANIDHAVVRGLNVLLLDAKRWKPGIYWTLRGTTRRGFTKVPHADKATLAAARRVLTQSLASQRHKHPELADVRVDAWNLVFPQGSGLTSVRAWKAPGNIRARRKTRTLETWLRRQVTNNSGAPSGPLLRVIHKMTKDRSTVVPHGVGMAIPRGR